MVVLGWLPGVVAGLMPLAVFLLVKAQATPAPNAKAADLSALFWDGLVGHLVVFSIVASSVSTFTSFPRLFASSQEKDTPIGPASLILVMLITLILVFSVAMYVLEEARITENGFLAGALLMAATVATSFYMEVAIANLRYDKRGEAT